MIPFNPDYHYIVDGQKTNSKNQALLWAGGDIARIHFYNMEHVWDKVDWTEPTETFEQLCDKRCRQLREQYDHLCLWLSAGYDSQTILASFIRAGIKIDEISFMHRGEYYDDPEIPFVLDTINYYKKHHNPKLRVQLADIGYEYTKNYYLKLKDNWILQPTDGSVRLSKSIASSVQNHHEGILRNRDATSGSRADIYGKEKPKLNLYQGNWYMQSNDAAVRDVMDAPVEQFYITEHLPELHIKQCYMGIRFFESIPDISHELVHQIQSMDRQYYQNWNLALGRIPVASPMSQHGELKTHFSNGPNSFDGSRVLKHFQSTGHTVNRYFQAGIDLMKNALPEGTNLHPTLLGRQWLIRKFDSKIN